MKIRTICVTTDELLTLRDISAACRLSDGTVDEERWVRETRQLLGCDFPHVRTRMYRIEVVERVVDRLGGGLPSEERL